jgi:hypothetical protein
MARSARARIWVVAAAAAIVGCGGGSGGDGSPAGTSRPAPPPAGPGAAPLPPGYQLAADLPTAVSHRLGRIGYRCDGPRRQLAVASSGATEFVRFFDGRGRVRLAGDLNAGVARGPSLRTLRQSVQIILAVEPGTAVVDVRLGLARAPCEVETLRVRVDSTQNIAPRSRRARRLDQLRGLALRPHRDIGSDPH